MLDREFTSLTKWVIELQSDDLLAMLIGCSPDHLPPLGSCFDFINRLWLQNPELEKTGRKDLFRQTRIKNLLPNLLKERNFQTAIPAFPEKSLIMLYGNATSPFIMKKYCRNSFLLLLLFLPWNLVLFPLITLRYPGMAPAPIPMQILMDTKYVTAEKTASPTAPAAAIFLTRMLPGDGTVTLMLTIMDIPSICCPAITNSTKLICPYTFVSLMRNDMTAPPASFPLLNSDSSILLCRFIVSALIQHMTTIPLMNYAGVGISAFILRFPEEWNHI